MKSKFALKIGITLLLLGYVGFSADRARLKTTIYSIKFIPFIGSYIILLLCSFPLALRLRTLLKPTVLQFSLKRLIQIQFISQFYSLMLPAGVGMAVVRWYKITENKVGRRVFIVITLIERVMLTLSLLLCTGIPLFFIRDESIRSLRSSALPVIFILIFFCFIFFSIFLNRFVYNRFSKAMQWMQSFFNFGLAGKITGIYEDCGLYIDNRALLIKAFFFNLLYTGMMFVRFYLVFFALGLALHPLTILWVSMLVLLVISLPLSIGGIGVRETGFAWLLVLYGVEPEKGMILGGMISIQMLLNIGVGAVLNMMETKHSTRRIR